MFFILICLLWIFLILAVGEIEPRAFAYAKHMLFQGSRIQMLSLVAVLSPWAPRGARLLGSLDFLVCAGEGSVDAHLEMHRAAVGRRRTTTLLSVNSRLCSTLDPLQPSHFHTESLLHTLTGYLSSDV